MGAPASTFPLRATAGEPRHRPYPGAVDTLQADATDWNALFGAPVLSAAEVQLLAELARVRRLDAGSVLFGHDDQACSMVALRSGQAALGWRTVDGSFHVERPVHAPGWLDAASGWRGTRHPLDARASSEVVVVELPCEALRQRLDDQPRLATRLIAVLAAEVTALAQAAHGLMHQDAPARFAHWLLQRAGGASVLRLGERKRDIASQLAITPETLSRLMRNLSDQGAIAVAGYTVTLLNRAALERVAGD